MLIPSIPLTQALKDGGVVRRYAVLGPVFLTTTEGEQLGSPDVALVQRSSVMLGPLPVEQLEGAAAWLDRGVEVVIFTLPDGDITSALESLATLPRPRIGVYLDYAQGGEGAMDALVDTLRRIKPVASHVVLRLPSGGGGGGEGMTATKVVAAIKEVKGRAGSEGYIQVILETESNGWSAEDITALHKAEVDVMAAADAEIGGTKADGKADGGAVVLPLRGGKVDAVDAFVACLRTDRQDGLYTTVVVDENGVALGLVYSSRESIRASVSCGRGVYYSRSKGGLWRKGDTSGAWQELVGLSFDCDSDAISFTVRQKGEPPVFCHLNRRNCWAEDRGLGALQRTLQGRKRSSPPGSYTARLFGDQQLLRNKLVEEAQELSEAEDADHVAAEAADLLYFALVRCVAAGVTLEDVERHLNARSMKLTRRPGNAKDHRIKAADAILNKGQANGSSSSS